ncbi:MAG TPA: hypothetical protein VNZ57_06335 [Longimicrobiales bacterium]|nr:hypothetical protein [Longimicrobiales bacterium]
MSPKRQRSGSRSTLGPSGQSSATAAPRPPIRVSVRGESFLDRPLVVAGARGFTTGPIVVGVLVTARAATGLELGGPVIDRLIGAAAALIALAAMQVATWAVMRTLTVLSTWVARRVPTVDSVVDGAILPLLRFLSRVPIVPGAIVMFGPGYSPESWPFILLASFFPFELPMYAFAVGGCLLAMAWTAWRVNPGRRARVVAASLALAGLLVAGGVVAWAVQPGSALQLALENPAALSSIPTLDLPDPSYWGAYRVATAGYGSGLDRRRPEFRPAPAWQTQPVDASHALADRRGIAALYAAIQWGYNASRLPINGRVWYPETGGPHPLVIIMHGSHFAGARSDHGYDYLAYHLASRGMVVASIDSNYLNNDPFFIHDEREFPARAWLILRHIDQFRTWSRTAGHPLAGRVDMTRVAIIGHSRAGEAAAFAASLARADTVYTPGLPPIAIDFDIRAVIGIAPTDGLANLAGNPIQLVDVDYLVIQGAHDLGIPAYWGIATYHRVQFSGEGNHLKVALYSHRANHNRFNTVWDDDDAGILSWLLDRGMILSAREQQQLAKTVVGAFLARSLLGQTEYDAFFQDPRTGRHWLPDDVVLSRWRTSSRIEIADFSNCNVDGEAIGFDTMACQDPLLRDRSTQGKRSVFLAWSRPASLRIRLDSADAAAIGPNSRITLALVPSSFGGIVDPELELRSTNGEVARVKLSTVVPLRPWLPAKLWKQDSLMRRYVPNAAYQWTTERFMQTYAVPVERFLAANSALDIQNIESVAIRMVDGGAMFLDDLGIEP